MIPSDKSAVALLTANNAKVSRVNETMAAIPKPSEEIVSVRVTRPHYELINFEAERNLHESSASEVPVASEIKT